MVSDLFLKNSLAANPAKSMYGFTLNRKRPGHFNLCFLANKNATVQTWVRIIYLLRYLYHLLIVLSLSAFPQRHTTYSTLMPPVSLNYATPSKSGKLYLKHLPTPNLTRCVHRHLHESQSAASLGGKTPFAGARTPGRPGGTTPGHASIRHVGRTPNPYGGAQTPYGAGPPPVPPVPPYGSGPQTYGYQTPLHRPPSGYPPPPASIASSSNPARAAMLPQASGSGWSQNSGWG